MKTFIVFTLIFLSANLCISQEREAAKPLLSDHYVKFAPNNNSIWFSNNGDMCFNPITSAAGWEWTSGSGNNVCFEAGLVFGGHVNGQLHVGGSTYRRGLQPGTIFPNGVPADTSDTRFRIYHIKKEDATTGTNPDYNQWPSQFGAPVDSIGNPFFYGDEQLWFVSNDLDTNRTKYLYGTNPIGLEIQTTVWGYSQIPDLKDVVFVKHLLINKSSSDMTDSYVGVWTDFDLGDANDDFVGVDTSLQLSYVYNGLNKDAVYGTPPSAGILLLQSPIISSPSDTVIFNGKKKAGFRYSPLSGFQCYVGGSSLYRDADFGVPAGAIMIYNNLKGYFWNGQEMTDLISNLPSKYYSPGDPVKKEGWIDGIGNPPADRRSLLSAGPFSIAKGDTQEVVYALIVQRGGDRLESVLMLKDYADKLKFFHKTQQRNFGFPKLNVEASYPNFNTVSLQLDAIDSNAIECKTILLSANKTIVADIPLFDDGKHNDGSAGDNHYSATWTSPVQREGVDVYFEISYPEQLKNRWLAKRCVPLAGIVKLVGVHVESDHLNQDGKANPGENVRISLDVKNETPFTLDEIQCVRLLYDTLTSDVYSIFKPFPSGSIKRRDYNDGQAGRFVTVDIPSSAKGNDSVKVYFLIRDFLNNNWRDSVNLEVFDLISQSADSLTIHISGSGTGSLGFRIIDPSQWKDRQYKISVSEPGIAARLVDVYDMVEKKFRGQGIPLPDNFAHDFPTIDGYRITQGTTIKPQVPDIDTTELIIPPVVHEYIPQQNNWLEPVPGYDWQTGNYFFGTSLTVYGYVPIKLIFSRTNMQKGYIYLRGGTPNYVYDYFGTVPFCVFDVSDSIHPRQINAAFVEQKGSSAHDSLWMPTTYSGDREYLFIFRSTYTGVPDSIYTSKKIFYHASNMDIMYNGWFKKKSPTATFQESDEVRITPMIPISKRDTFIVNIKGKITRVNREVVPNKVTLYQNYPNPFTGSTAIGYRLLAFGNVKLTVFDLLGRKVATLVDEGQEAGMKQIEVKVKEKKLNNDIYFYQLEANGQTIRKKMIILQ